MDDKWKITVWGVRGSFPVPAADFLEYGGNTSCISVECGGELAVFDAGSGLADLGAAISGRGGKKKIHLFLSHFHLDHVMGLAVFQPFYDPSAEIHLYGGAAEGVDFHSRLKELAGRPFWPLGLEDFPAEIQVHEIGPGSRFILGESDVTVRTMAGNHPGGSLLYRLEDGSRSMVYGLDCELTEDMAGALADFARDTHLLVWDANFTTKDLRKGWGHSTWEQGLELGKRAGVREVLMTHYSREYADLFLREQERMAKAGLSHEGSGREGIACEGSGREGIACEGSGREGIACEGTACEGSGREGSGREGTACEGAAHEGTACEGSTEAGHAHETPCAEDTFCTFARERMEMTL